MDDLLNLLPADDQIPLMCRMEEYLPLGLETERLGGIAGMPKALCWYCFDCMPPSGSVIRPITVFHFDSTSCCDGCGQPILAVAIRWWESAYSVAEREALMRETDTYLLGASDAVIERELEMIAMTPGDLARLAAPVPVDVAVFPWWRHAPWWLRPYYALCYCWQSAWIALGAALLRNGWLTPGRAVLGSRWLGHARMADSDPADTVWF